MARRLVVRVLTSKVTCHMQAWLRSAAKQRKSRPANTGAHYSSRWPAIGSCWSTLHFPMDKSCNDRSKSTGLEAIKEFSRKGAKENAKKPFQIDLASFLCAFAPLREKLER